jgi:large subunit ribosomal protein L24
MPTPLSRLPRKQRKSLYTAHNTMRRRLLTVALSKELRDRYGRRQLPVRKGDTVRVLAGSYEGQEERVAKVNSRAMTLTLDNITLKKADQKLKALPVRPNHLILTKLNLSDAWRRRVLRVTEEPAPARAAPEEPKEAEAKPKPRRAAPAKAAATERPTAPRAETPTAEGSAADDDEPGTEAKP